MWQEEYKDCLEYIDRYWEKIIFKPSIIRLKTRFITIPTLLRYNKKNPQVFYVPNTFFVPNLGTQKRICYWDTFFMFRGLMGTKREGLMKSMIDNFIYIFKQYQIIPNFNTPAGINRSQPPFLSSMILDAYFTPLNKYNSYKYYKGVSARVYKLQNKIWLQKVIQIAKKEYELVWLDQENYYNHRVKGYLLSRYGDRDIGYAHSSELESGWDFTSRFFSRCDQFFPIDLNVFLYKYEQDFAKIATILDNTKDKQYWEQKALERSRSINQYMWDKQKGFFFDYGYDYQQISDFMSLASFTPMWAGLATVAQAKQMIEKLPKFEAPHGLTITTKESLPKPIDLSIIPRRYHPAVEEVLKPKQWDYPNVWAPLEYLTVIGLLKYGYIADAKRIMEKSVKAHATGFRKYGTFFEKLNGETGELGKGALYGDQELGNGTLNIQNEGFGWTNAIFYRYIQILESLGKDDIYIDTSEQPPYELSILH